MKVPSVVMSSVLLVIFIAMVAISFTYPEGARFQPLVIGLPAIALCILQIVLDLTQRNAVAAEGSEGGNEYARAEAEVARATGREIHFDVAHQQMPVEEGLPPEEEFRREIIVWTFFLAFIGAIVAFGFWPSIPVFIFLFLTVQGGVKIPKALFMAAVATAVFYGVFEIVLKVKVFEGFWGPWLWDQIAPVLKSAGLPIRV